MFVIDAHEYYQMKEYFEINVKCPYKTCVTGESLLVDFKTPSPCIGNSGNVNCPNYQRLWSDCLEVKDKCSEDYPRKDGKTMGLAGKDKDVEYSKKVLLPIQVPRGDYCWDSKRICEYFDNEGGHGRCELGLGALKRNEVGDYPKPEKCRVLEEDV